MTGRLFFFFLLLAASAPLHAQTSEEAALTASAAPQTFAGRDRLDFADGLYGRNMYDMAAEEYSRLITDFPRHPMLADAYYRHAESLFFQKKYDEAIQAYNKYLSDYPAHAKGPMAKLRIGESLYQLERKDEALESFMQAQASPEPLVKNAAGYYAGRIYLDKDDFEKAHPFLTAASAQKDGNPFYQIAAYHLGNAALKKGSYDAAAEALKKAEEGDAPELKLYAHFGLGQAAYHQKNYAAAADYFLKAYQNAGTPEIKADAFLNYLTSLYETGNHAKIIEEYKNNPELAGKNQTIVLIAAKSASAAGEHALAADLYGRLTQGPEASPALKEDAEEGILEALLSSGNAEGAAQAAASMNAAPETASERWLYLAQESMKRAGRHGEAAALIEVLIRRFPESQYKPQAMMNRAYLLLESGKSAEARNAFDDFLKTYPEHKHSKQMLMNRISLDITLEDFDGALQSSKAFMEVYGASEEAADVLFQQGSLYLKKKDHAQAAKVFEDFLARYPQSEKRSEALFYLGYAVQMQDDFEKAAGHYSQIDKTKVSEEIHYSALKNTAYAYVRLDQLDKAADVYYEILKTYPAKKLSADVYFWLADYLQKKQEGAKLLEVLESFKDLPESKDKPGLMQYFFAEAYRLTGNHETAVSHYNTALAYPDVFKAEALMGKALSETALGRNDAAALNFEEAIHAAGDNHELALQARLYLADVYFTAQQYKEAGKAYLSAAILYEDPKKIPPALMKAGESFEKAGLKDEALKAYEEMTTRFKDHAAAPDAERKLNQLKKIAV